MTITHEAFAFGCAQPRGGDVDRRQDAMATLDRRGDEFKRRSAEKEARKGREAVLASVRAALELRARGLSALGADRPGAAMQRAAIISVARGWIADHAAA